MTKFRMLNKLMQGSTCELMKKIPGIIRQKFITYFLPELDSPKDSNFELPLEEPAHNYNLLIPKRPLKTCR